MNDITEVHEQLLAYLLNVKENESDLTFSLRKTNREGRLADGYWFHGNDYYVAISFWSGNDWKNRTPNIIFVVTDTLETFLEVNVSDSPVKREFVELYLVRQLGLEKDGKRYRKAYTWSDYMPSFMEFVYGEKKQIDHIITAHREFFLNKSDEDRIHFIREEEFNNALNKTLEYRNQLNPENASWGSNSLKSIEIKSFGPIKNAGIFNIPENTQWVFLTGENGTGKTTLLRAIAIVLGNDVGDLRGLNITEESLVKATLYTDYSNETFASEQKFQHVGQNVPGIAVKGFAAYGASRLTNLSTVTGKRITYSRKRSSPLYNLTHTDGILFDLLSKYGQWDNKKIEMLLIERFENIKIALLELIPNLNNIHFGLQDNPKITWYYEEDENGEVYQRVQFHQLASGIRSMVAMFGDMMCRLFDQQPEKTDPADLTGVVLIDEIDLHLHPKLQKLLVEQLSNTFQKIQFIVTTHSPIPLLGASSRSKFFKVKRTSEENVEIVDLSDIEVQRMLPTAILTSDLFNMDGLFERSSVSSEAIRTEENYDDIKINDEVREKLKDIAGRLKNTDENSQ